MHNYFLLDGIQLGATQISEYLRRGEQIYKDFGDAAGLAGPILMEADDELEHAATLVEQVAPRCFAVARLQSVAGAEAMVSHLREVRYFRHAHEQFFLRYADTRVFHTLMQVLDDAQKCTLFGPASMWSVVDREGRPAHYTRPDGRASSGPLSLSKSQYLQLLRLSRPDQLLAEVIADDPDLASIGSDAERHQWARQTLEFVNTHRAHSFPYRLAVAAVAVRTHGAALNDPGFVEALRLSLTQHNGSHRLYEWAPADASRENHV